MQSSKLYAKGCKFLQKVSPGGKSKKKSSKRESKDEPRSSKDSDTAHRSPADESDVAEAARGARLDHAAAVSAATAVLNERDVSLDYPKLLERMKNLEAEEEEEEEEEGEGEVGGSEKGGESYVERMLREKGEENSEKYMERILVKESLGSLSEEDSNLNENRHDSGVVPDVDDIKADNDDDDYVDMDDDEDYEEDYDDISSEFDVRNSQNDDYLSINSSGFGSPRKPMFIDRRMSYQGDLYTASPIKRSLVERRLSADTYQSPCKRGYPKGPEAPKGSPWHSGIESTANTSVETVVYRSPKKDRYMGAGNENVEADTDADADLLDEDESHGDEETSVFDDDISHIDDDTSHFDDDTSHLGDDTSHFDDNASQSDDITSHFTDDTSHYGDNVSRHDDELIQDQPYNGNVALYDDEVYEDDAYFDEPFDDYTELAPKGHADKDNDGGNLPLREPELPAGNRNFKNEELVLEKQQKAGREEKSVEDTGRGEEVEEEIEYEEQGDEEEEEEEEYYEDEEEEEEEDTDRSDKNESTRNPDDMLTSGANKSMRCNPLTVFTTIDEGEEEDEDDEKKNTLEQEHLNMNDPALMNIEDPSEESDDALKTAEETEDSESSSSTLDDGSSVDMDTFSSPASDVSKIAENPEPISPKSMEDHQELKHSSEEDEAGDEEEELDIMVLKQRLESEEGKTKVLGSQVKNLKQKLGKMKKQLMEEKCNSKLLECNLKELVQLIDAWQKENAKHEAKKSTKQDDAVSRDADKYKRLYEKSNRELDMTRQTMKVELDLKAKEVRQSKEKAVKYKKMYEKANAELAEAKEASKKQVKISNVELKAIIKDLLRYKRIYDETSNELTEAKRTITNLNTMVEDLNKLNQLLMDDFKKQQKEKEEKKDEKKRPRRSEASAKSDKSGESDASEYAQSSVVSKPVPRRGEIRASACNINDLGEPTSDTVKLYIGVIPPDVNRREMIEKLCLHSVEILRDVIRTELYLEEKKSGIIVYAVLTVEAVNIGDRIMQNYDVT